MKKGIRENIINSLLPGPTVTQSLVLEISLQTKSTVQAVYKSLRILKQEGVITVHNKDTSLSLIWIHKEKERLIFAEYAYLAGKDIITKLSIDKSRVTFQFKTIAELDLFWTHAYTILTKQVDVKVSRYMLIPHDFFLYAREETDTFWMDKNITKDFITRLVITHPFKADKMATKKRKERKDTPFEFLFSENPLKQDSHLYYNILGDYIFKGSFDKDVNKKLESFICGVKKLPLLVDEKETIEAILSTNGKFTLIIEKNHKKATLAENKIEKYF